MAKSKSVERSTQKKPLSPTRARDEAFEKAHAFLNKELFGGKLPNDFSFNFINRANSRGHFSPDAWGSRINESTAHEINLNPASFHGRTDEQILSTLGHEMCHQFQHIWGTPLKRGNHNEEWADLMKSIGLQPSSTGMVGGNETGQKMSHYIIDGGPFQVAYRKLAASGFTIPWQQAARSTKGRPKKNSKPRNSCGACGGNLWGVHDALCKPCALDAAGDNEQLVAFLLQFEMVRQDGADSDDVGEELPLAAETIPTKSA